MKIITENLLTEHQGKSTLLWNFWPTSNEQIIAGTVINLAKTDTELNNVKSYLTDARMDLASKLEGTVLLNLHL
jgi:hypothetical protein